MKRVEQTDVLIIGAGPAGLAAAWAAAQSGKSITVIDDNPQPGGQIWRGQNGAPAGGPSKIWLERLRTLSFKQHHSTMVISAPQANVIHVESAGGLIELRYRKLILACGARERFVPFPGWTLPGVMGAGGLQALVKGGLDITDKRVIVAGTGPLLIAVAATLKKHGARIVLIAEQTPWRRMFSFASRLVLSPAKLAQAIAYKTNLFGVPQRTGTWPVKATRNRDGSLVVTMSHSGSPIDCDYLACGYFLVPNLELPVLLDCKHTPVGVMVDENQTTNLPDILAAGEVTGIGGLEKSLIEGQIAGFISTGAINQAKELFAKGAAANGFAVALRRAFALRDELKSLADDSTLLCRCEDVTMGRVRNCTSFRQAKLHTRCGMGSCQGRICGGAAQFLFGFEDTSVRPPIMPVTLNHLAGDAESTAS